MKHLEWREFAALTRRALRAWRDDGAATMGASLAFYTLFSLAPLLLVAIGLAGFFVGRDEAQAALLDQVARLAGEPAAMGVEDLLESASRWESGIAPAIVGMATLLFGATTVFAELRADLDRIWRHKAPARGFMRTLATRLLSFLMVAGIGVLLLASLAATACLSAIGAEVFGGSTAGLYAIELVPSFLVLTGLFAMIYKILPSARLAWTDVWIGAMVTSALFWVGKLAIALYISHAAVGSTFGAAGALVLVIAWVYYSAQVFFLGAEFTREFALMHGSRRHERLRRPLSEIQAANEDLLDRSRAIVAGKDPATRLAR